MKKKQEVQYRYYDLPENSYVLALLGSGWIRPYGSDLDAMHFHNHLEIGYCYDGKGTLAFPGKTCAYQSGSFSVIPKNHLHNTIAAHGTTNRWEYIFVDVDSFINSMYEKNTSMGKSILDRVNSGELLLTYQDNREIADIVLSIMNLYRENGELYLECAKGLLLALIVRLACLQPDNLRDVNESQAGIGTIVGALDYVDKNYPEKIQVSDMANACHLSESHLRRLFHQHMNLSPVDYINLVRLEAVCKKLRTSRDPIQDIAISCGFASISSLNRIFKKTLDVSPHEWRKTTQFHEESLANQRVVVFNGWR